MSGKHGSWCDEEVKTLFKFVEIKRSEGIPLIAIFEQYANFTSRQKNSVRNFYYGELELLQENGELCKKLGISLQQHKAKNVVPFGDNDTKELIKDINLLLEAGYSVRGACLELAGGDAKKMIRLQNKFRQETKYKKKVQMGNVIKMPIKKEAISDGEINALFLGLIKLVKKQERENQREQFEKQLLDGNEKLKIAIAEGIANRYKIEKLQEQIKILSDENESLKASRIEARIKKLNRKTAPELLGDFITSCKHVGVEARENKN